MKNIIMILLIGFLAGCATGSEVKEESSDSKTEVTNIEKEESTHGELQLNNGSKWKLDASTRLNIAELRETLGYPVNKDYAKLAASVREKTSKLVRECRMQGPDHDALHLWLENFLKDLKDLEDEKGKKQAESIDDLRADLVEFDSFFE